MRRPYFFEIFTIVNLVIIQLLLWRITPAPIATLPRLLLLMVPAFLAQTAVGVAIRALVAWRQRQARDFLAVIRSREWLLDTVRIVLFSALSVHAYGWIKLSIPLLHPRLFDQELWNFDQAMFFGHSPNVFFLDLFSNRAALRVVDWTYGNVFVASINIASIFFASAPSKRLRIGFTNSNTLMWIAGAWLYMLLPSLGPAYRFPELWLPLASSLPHTQQLQRILMNNYQIILRGARQPVNVLYGIAAFPSLHVSFEVLAYLWMRRVWRLGEILFALFTVIIFIGSVVTGWHYLIDSIVGVVLAIVCWAAVVWQYPIVGKRFL
jgi:PAP2 superfamily protein